MRLAPGGAATRASLLRWPMHLRLFQAMDYWALVSSLGALFAGADLNWSHWGSVSASLVGTARALLLH